jgi:hypothetical protein
MTRFPWLTKKLVGHTLHVKLASRCSRLDFRIDEGSSSCLAAPQLLQARHARPLPSLHGFLLSGLQRPSRTAPMLSPCGSALSHRAAAPRALSSTPAPSPTASPILPRTCACAFPHRELRAQARADHSTTRRRPRIRTRTLARRRPARPPLLAHGPCTHRQCAAHACASPASALQRLHSSTVRAVRSRTRRHVAPASAYAAAPPRPSHSRARRQPCLQRPPRTTARSGLLASTRFSHLPHSCALFCAASRHAATSASPEPSCTGSPPRSAASLTQLGSARAYTLGSRSRQHRPLGSCTPPASTALLPAPLARVPRLNPAVPPCTSSRTRPRTAACCGRLSRSLRAPAPGPPAPNARRLGRQCAPPPAPACTRLRAACLRARSPVLLLRRAAAAASPRAAPSRASPHPLAPPAG